MVVRSFTARADRGGSGLLGGVGAGQRRVGPDSSSGVVGSVDEVPSVASDSQGSAQFPVTLSIPKLTPQQLQRVRLGMSARLTIVTYNNDQAIVVPAQAISRGDGVMTVEYRAAMDKPVERVNVTTGQSTAQGVEVFGLKPGFVKVGP